MFSPICCHQILVFHFEEFPNKKLNNETKTPLFLSEAIQINANTNFIVITTSIGYWGKNAVKATRF